MKTTFEGQVQFMAWGDSHTSGPWIKLRLVDSEALEPFRGMTAAKAGMAGQLLACVLVEETDDERPVEPKPKGGPLSQLAGRWCEDEQFQRWIAARYPESAKQALHAGAASPSALAAQLVRWVCNVPSRAELDHNEDARAAFDQHIRHPYQAYLQAKA